MHFSQTVACSDNRGRLSIQWTRPRESRKELLDKRIKTEGYLLRNRGLSLDTSGQAAFTSQRKSGSL